ncbi:Ribonuclease P protein component 2 [Dictyocoela muelleri]|nr:Ribonuclease P protein component 2 [Dictyocoela muelleri]
MVRIKYRYVVLKMTNELNKIFNIENVEDIFRDLVMDNFGEIGVSKLNVKLIDFLVNNQIIIVRISRDILKEFLFSVIMCANLNSIFINFSIIQITGTLRKLDVLKFKKL